MKWIKKFNESSIYEFDWHNIMPKNLIIIEDDKKIEYELGNIMMHFDMVQVVYESNIWGEPGDLEFDFYFLKRGSKYVIDVDITWGDSMVLEFSLSGSNINIIRNDKNRIKIGFDSNSIKEILHLFNQFSGFHFEESQIVFLKP
jgi:hypothetical protein